MDLATKLMITILQNRLQQKQIGVIQTISALRATTRKATILARSVHSPEDTEVVMMNSETLSLELIGGVPQKMEAIMQNTLLLSSI